MVFHVPAYRVDKVKKIEDASLRAALKKAIQDNRIDEKDVLKLFEACLADKENASSNRLSSEEVKGLWLIADRSKMLSDKARWMLRDLLLTHASHATYGPHDIEGFAVGVNFAGPGFNGKFRLRPANLFDLAAKIHDLTYQLNGLEIDFTFRPKSQVRSKLAQSRKAKADHVFRRINSVAYPDGPSGQGIRFYNFVAKGIFDGKSNSEFISGDGFINPLVVPAVQRILCDPQQCLMFPYSLISEQHRPTRSLAVGPVPAPRKADYERIVPEDHTYWKWFTKKFAAEWTAMTIGSVCANGKVKK